MNAVMLSAEMSLCAGEIARTRTLLASDLVVDLVGLDIGVLRLFLMRLEGQEREQKDERSSSAIEALTESLKLITRDEARLADVDSVRWMIGRIVESWKDLGADRRVEEDVLVSVAVELGIYPSKGQRPAWVERGLTSRSLGVTKYHSHVKIKQSKTIPELTHALQTGVGAGQPGPRPGGQPQAGGGAVGAAQAGGGGRGGGALLGGGGGALDPGGEGQHTGVGVTWPPCL